MGSIYLIRNTINGKCYIGQTTLDAIKERIPRHLHGHGSLLVARAIAKYGKDTFTFEILHDGIINEFLNHLEIEAIKEYNSFIPNGYNLTSGGEGITTFESPEGRNLRKNKLTRIKRNTPEFREQRNANLRERRKNDPEYRESENVKSREKRAKNLEHTRKREQAHYTNNSKYRDNRKAQANKYYAQNHDRINARRRHRYANDPEYHQHVRTSNNQRHAKKRAQN